MLTARELDDLRQAAKNTIRDVREEYAKFRAKGREYLEQPAVELEEIEELLADATEYPRQIPNASPVDPAVETPPAPRPEQVSGLSG